MAVECVFLLVATPTQARWHYLLLSFLSSQRETKRRSTPTINGAITAVKSVTSIKSPPLLGEIWISAKSNYITIRTLYLAMF